jgi:hypothetical protein
MFRLLLHDTVRSGGQNRVNWQRKLLQGLHVQIFPRFADLKNDLRVINGLSLPILLRKSCKHRYIL